jgi:uncharacterized protein YpmB
MINSVDTACCSDSHCMFSPASPRVQALQKTEAVSQIHELRQVHWFEKFNWFISSEGYLVLSGRDLQQHELLVKWCALSSACGIFISNGVRMLELQQLELLVKRCTSSAAAGPLD